MGIFETVGKFITENSPYTYIVGATLLVIILGIILAVVITKAISKKNKESEVAVEDITEEKLVETTDEVKDEEVDEPVVETEDVAKQTVKKASKTKETTTEVSEEKPDKQKQKKDEHSGIYHVTKRKTDGKWQVKYRKGEKAIKLFDTQAEAIAYAKKLAASRDGSVTVHKKTGQIRKH